MVYPRKCPICGRILRDQHALACPGCPGLLCPVIKNYCLRCGRPVLESEELCPDCAGRERNFTKGRSVYLYDRSMQRSLIRFKKNGDRTLCDFYSEAMVYYLKEQIGRWKPDILVPIPMTDKSIRKRGFNQAQDLAQSLGEKLGIPIAVHLLVKVRQTKEQKNLDSFRRRQNVSGAFFATQKIQGLKILLVDDVFTTGSTLDEAAFCLKKAGAAQVFFVTLCTVRM